MKAVAMGRSLPADDPASLFDIELPDPVAAGRDLLVEVAAVSVNPVDTKVRRRRPPVETAPRVLGWDAAGIVRAAGPQCTLFKPGDAVFYAGALERPGSNSQLHLVDERLAGRKPERLSFAAAAALPLTALTAWETLAEQLRLQKGETVLLIAGAGGVGSMAIQIGRQLGLTVLATASRPETETWCRDLGAHHVVAPQNLVEAVRALGIREVDAIANFADTDGYWEAMAELIRPFGRICSIVENKQPLDMARLRGKSVTFAWELMFTRSTFQTPDMGEQGRILNQISAWLDAGILRTTLTQTLSPIDAAHIRAAHLTLESGRSIGKIALEGWTS